MAAVASKGNNRDGEMVLCFRALAVLARGPIQFPAPILGSSQPPGAPVPGDIIPSSGLHGHHYTRHTHKHKQKMHFF